MKTAPTTLLKKLSFLCICILISGTLISCSWFQKTDTTDETASDDVVLKILHSPWPPDGLNYLAYKKGFFEKHGVNVEMVFVDGYDGILENQEKNNAHTWNVTMLDVVTAAAEGKNWQVIMVQDYSVGADGVLTMPDKGIKTVADLKGRKVGVEGGTIGEFFLAILLEREGLTLEDLDTVSVTAEDVPEALKNGEIDAGVSYETALSEAVADGAEILVDSSKERGVIVDAYVADRDHVAKHKDAYVKAMAAILEAGDFFRSNPEEAADIMKEHLGMSKEEVIETFKKLRVTDLRDNQTAFSRSSGFESLHILARQALEYIEEQGTAVADVDLDQVINGSIIEAIAGSGS